MNFTSMPATGLMKGQWAPYRAPLRATGSVLGQAAPPPAAATAVPSGPITVVQPKPVAFIDGPFFSLLMDGAMATGAGIAWQAYSRESKNTEYSAEKRQKNKRWSYFFMGLTGLATIKALLDASRLMR